MNDRSDVWLWERGGQQLVPAQLIDGVDRNAIIRAAASWKPLIEARVLDLMRQGIPRSLWPQHMHWDWEQKTKYYTGLAYQTFGIECEGEIQGLMLVDTVTQSCRIPTQVGKPLVHVLYLATAPWNDRDFSAQPRFGGVGKVLLAAAIQLSIDNEFKGRISLHSLPQADAFYRGCGFTDLGKDPEVQNLSCYEMTPEQAQAFNNKRGQT